MSPPSPKKYYFSSKILLPSLIPSPLPPCDKCWLLPSAELMMYCSGEEKFENLFETRKVWGRRLSLSFSSLEDWLTSLKTSVTFRNLGNVYLTFAMLSAILAKLIKKDENSRQKSVFNYALLGHLAYNKYLSFSFLLKIQRFACNY